MGDEWRLLRFHRTVPEAHKRVREMIPRIYTFADDLDSGADGNLLVLNFLTHFQTELPKLFGLGVLCNDELIGHLLIQFEEYYGCTNMTVLQYQVDKTAPRAFHASSWEEVLEIADFAGANNIVGICPDEKVERLHKIFHGMKRYATLMTLDLDEIRRGRLKEAANG